MAQEGSNKDFVNILETTIREFESGKSPAKVLTAFLHDLAHFADASRNLLLLEVYLYGSYYRASVIIDYFMYKAQPIIIDSISKSNLPNFLKESLRPELAELRGSYFDTDFLPVLSEMRDKFTTFKNVSDPKETTTSHHFQLLTEVVYDTMTKASKEVSAEITKELKSLLESAAKSNNPIDSFSKSFKELVIQHYKEEMGWL